MDVYPFARLAEAKRQVAATGVQLIDFGLGEPREQTPGFIRAALADAIEPMSRYPSSDGLPELRAAIARWCARRFGAELDPDRELIPTLGSKEGIFHLAEVVADPQVGRDLVAVPSPGYPVPARGAVFAGLRVLELPLSEESGWLPALEAVPDDAWDRLAVFWVNYPNNPTGATAPLAFYDVLAARARRHDFVLASDEAYSELFFGPEPPASALQLPTLENVVVFNTLSKRSSMPGYRSGFVAGDPRLVAALKRYRPNVGVAPLEMVQRASVAAWDDEHHVEAVRARYAAKRELMLPALARAGLRVAGGDASFFLWCAVPGGDDEAWAARALKQGIVVAPGSFFGRHGAGFVRVALVPTPQECERAARIVARL